MVNTLLLALALTQVPSAPSGLHIRSDVREETFFETWAPQAYRAYALDSQAEINSLSGGEDNPNIRYDAELDAAVMWTRQGDRGIALGRELRLPVAFPRPVGGQRFVVIYEFRVSPELARAYREQIGNGGTKFWHIRGADRSEGDYRDGLFKYALNMRTGANCQAPCIGRLSNQMAWEHLGANAINNEPVAPARWSEFDIHEGVWTWVLQVWEVEAPVDDAVSRVSAWIGDESRPAFQVVDGLLMRMPWSEEHGRGYQYVHVLQSWKDTMPWDVSLAIRRVLVLDYDGPIEALLERT